MAKQLLTFVALLILQGVASSVAAPKSSGSKTFDEWLATFDPSTAVASKAYSCAAKPTDGFYPDEPDTCTSTYYACFGGVAYQQTCLGGNVFDSTPTVKACVGRYDAQSEACEKYTPNCQTDPLAEQLPLSKCGTTFYICWTRSGPPQFYPCNPNPGGNPAVFFNPRSGECEDLTTTSACYSEPEVVIEIPEYGCGPDKITDGSIAYALSPCSESYFTCSRLYATPTPGSCRTTPGTVFDYKLTVADQQGGTSTLCVDRSTRPKECTSSFLGKL